MNHVSRALGTFRKSIDAVVDHERRVEFADQLAREWSWEERDHDNWTIAITEPSSKRPEQYPSVKGNCGRRIREWKHQWRQDLYASRNLFHASARIPPVNKTRPEARRIA